MGLMDMFSGFSEWDFEDFASGGIIGAAMGAKARREGTESGVNAKPSLYCLKACIPGEQRCAPCLEIQQRFEHAIYQLEQLENFSKMSVEQLQKLSAQKRITKCGFCGAPFESGHKECPYCNTEYPADSLDFDIPLSQKDIHIQLMQKAEEAWSILNEKTKYQEEMAAGGGLGTFQNIVFCGTFPFQNALKQSAAKIKKGADYYGIPISQYISGVMLGEKKTPDRIYG